MKEKNLFKMMAFLLTCLMLLFSTVYAEDLESITGLQFSELDELGRCGPASALITPDTLAKEERGSIGHIKPSGWHQNKYPGLVDSEPPYLYNRCHLVAFMFYGNATNDERNLITGTRYFNAKTMLDYELQVVNYIEETGDSVWYRVTPVYDGDGLLATGVTIEAKSVAKEGLELNVFCENIQPGIHLDYQTGENWIDDSKEAATEMAGVEDTYVCNKNSHIFHRQECDSVNSMKEKNKVLISGTRNDIIADGWKPCQNCNP